jgi:hypothetical protein
MRLLIAVVAAAAPIWGAPRAAPLQDTGGRIESDELVSIELITPSGQREIRTPEGFLRVESDEPDDPSSSTMGSFGTYHAAVLAPSESGVQVVDADPSPADAAPAEPAPPLRRDGMFDTSAPTAGADPCHAQRNRYFRRVLRMSGVDVERPLELLDGLAGPGSRGGNLLIGGYLMPGVNPIQPLAWDQELRSLARDLATCEARAVPASAR